MKDRIDFCVGGNQKCGTGTLHALLRQHPGTAMSIPKEQHFFDRAGFDGSEESYRRYHRDGWSVDGPLDDDVVYGESTPKYVMCDASGRPQYLQRIRSYNPDMKFVVLVRDPVDRAYSQWKMLRRTGRRQVPDSFAELMDGLVRSGEPTSLLDLLIRGHYGTIVSNLLEAFGPANCLFLAPDDVNDCTGVVTDFLGLEPFDFEPVRVHVGGYDDRPSPEIRARLQQHYRSEIEQFEALTGIESGHWLR